MSNLTDLQELHRRYKDRRISLEYQTTLGEEGLHQLREARSFEHSLEWAIEIIEERRKEREALQEDAA